jgi:O-antigen/teichoic acid export membrane protein
MNTAFSLIIARAWSNLCGLLAFLVAARFVTPAEIGIYALASSVVLLSHSLVGAGFAEHVISRDPDRRDTATAFWSVVAFGSCGTLFSFGAAILADLWLDQPQIALIIAWMAPMPAIWSIATVPEATLIRDGRGSALAGSSIAADTIGMAVLILLLLMGHGIMALVANRLVSVVVMSAGILRAAGLPKGLRHFDIAAAKRIGWFSTGVIGSRLSFWANQFGTELVIGIVLSTTAVGYYRMASRLAGALYSIIWQGPAAAQLAYFGRAPDSYKAYLHALRLHLALVAPILVGAAMAAPILIEVLLGPTWQPSALVFSLLCLCCFPAIGCGIASTMLVARGRSHRAFLLDSGAAAVTVAAMLVGAHIGLAATAIAKLLVTVLFLVLTVRAVAELRPFGLRRTLRVFGSVAAGGAVMALAMEAVLLLWPAPAETLPILLRIAVAGLVGVAAYAAATLLVLRRTGALIRVIVTKRWGHRLPLPRMLGRGWRFGVLSL